MENIWLGYPTNALSHMVHRLTIHLPGEHNVVLTEENIQKAVDGDLGETALTQYFELIAQDKLCIMRGMAYMSASFKQWCHSSPSPSTIEPNAFAAPKNVGCSNACSPRCDVFISLKLVQPFLAKRSCLKQKSSKLIGLTTYIRPIVGLLLFQYIPGSMEHALGLSTHFLLLVFQVNSLGMS